MKVLYNSELLGAYTDCYKSNEKARTIIVEVNAQLNISNEEEYLTVKLDSKCMDSIKEEGHKREIGIDCDMFTLVYGIQMGLNAFQ